jgi:hypothetical protein
VSPWSELADFRPGSCSFPPSTLSSWAVPLEPTSRSTFPFELVPFRL